MMVFSLIWVYLLIGLIIVEEIFLWNGIGCLFVISLRILDFLVI